MSAFLVTLLLALSRPQESGIEAALGIGDFARAWELMESEASTSERARWRAEILYRGGDPSGALDAAREGLRADPRNLVLLFRAAASALWLQDPVSSDQLVARLETAVEESDTLSNDERRTWGAAVTDFRARTRELQRHAEEREIAVTRSRWISFTGIALLLALIGWNVRPAHGRSSRPVS